LPCTYPTPSPAALVGIPDSGTPSGYNYGTPDNSVAGVADGHYVIINLSATPIVVNGISDTGYDLVYYERATGSGSTLGIDMDKVILSISMDNSTYYVVFNWGDGTPDANSSVASVAGTEADNQHINAVDLYQDPSATSSPKTGIEIDVDNAPSHPPPGNYSYLAIQAPAPPASSDGADVDSVQVLP